MRPELRASLTLNQAYWLATLTADDLARNNLELAPVPADHPRRFDLFAPANFLNFVPWAKSVELLLAFDPARIQAYDQALVQRLLDGLEGSPWRVSSPLDPAERSALVFVTHQDPERNAAAERLLTRAGIDVAQRRGHLRLSPHFYNTEADIDRALETLLGDAAGGR